MRLLEWVRLVRLVRLEAADHHRCQMFELQDRCSRSLPAETSAGTLTKTLTCTQIQNQRSAALTPCCILGFYNSGERESAGRSRCGDRARPDTTARVRYIPMTVLIRGEVQSDGTSASFRDTKSPSASSASSDLCVLKPANQSEASSPLTEPYRAERASVISSQLLRAEGHVFAVNTLHVFVTRCLIDSERVVTAVVQLSPEEHCIVGRLADSSFTLLWRLKTAETPVDPKHSSTDRYVSGK